MTHFLVPKALKVKHDQTNSIIHGNKVELRIRLSCSQQKCAAGSGHTGYGHSNLHWVLTSIKKKKKSSKEGHPKM